MATETKHSDSESGGQAFPLTYPGTPGMTLRDWFAGQAIVGIMSSLHEYRRHYQEIASRDAEDVQDAIAREAYEVADRLISAREQ